MRTKATRTSKPPGEGPVRPGPSLAARAMGLLARREHSRAELARKLQRYAADRDEIERVLDELERRKLLSDARYAEARVNSLAARYGSRRLQRELQEKGVDPALAAGALERVRRDELARARAIWAKRFGASPADALDRARQMRFLHTRGFSFDIIRRVVGDDEG